jgi:hypothetical protein
MNYSEYQERVRRMSDGQKQRIKDKCQWEHVGWLGVATDWPSLFDVEGMPPASPYQSDQQYR